jgi:hypothetical protein
VIPHHQGNGTTQPQQLFFITELNCLIDFAAAASVIKSEDISTYPIRKMCAQKLSLKPGNTHPPCSTAKFFKVPLQPKKASIASPRIRITPQESNVQNPPAAPDYHPLNSSTQPDQRHLPPSIETN